MKYFKIYTNCCRVAKAYVEITESAAEDCIYDSVAFKDWQYENVETNEDDELTADYLNKESDFVVNALKEAEEESFYCGDFYLYARPDDFNMYDIARNNC